MIKVHVVIFFVMGLFLLASLGQASSLPHVSEAVDLSIRTTLVNASASAIIISEEDFKAALAKSAFYQVEPQLRDEAIDLTAKANEARGVIGTYTNQDTVQQFSGHIFLVARDPLLSRDGKLVQATHYYVAAVELSGEANWIGTSARFAMDESMTASLAGRCCGRSILAIKSPQPTPTGPGVPGTGPCDPPRYCGDVVRGITVTPPSQLEARINAGLPPIGLELYPTNSSNFGPPLPDLNSDKLTPQTFGSVHRVVDPTCARVKLVCEDGDTGFIRGQGGTADIPSGSTSCMSSPTSKTFYFPNVPPICMITDPAYQEKTGGGRPVIPTICGGVCVQNCKEPGTSFINGLPPGCTMMSPVEGSSICKKPTPQEEMETLMAQQRMAGYIPGSSGDYETCQPATRYGKICTRCNADGCKQIPIRYTADPGVAAEGSPTNEEESRDEQLDKEKKKCGGDASCEAKVENCRANPDCTIVDPEYDLPGEVVIVGSAKPTSDPKPDPVPSATNTNPNTPGTSPGPTPPGPKPPKQRDRFEDGPFIPDHGKPDFPDPQKAAQPEPSKAGDPVVIGTGALSHLETDLSFDGPVRPLEFRRIYDSQSGDRSTFGSNWRHNWDQTIVQLNIETTPAWALPYCAGFATTTTCLVFRDEHGGQTLFFLDMGSGLFMPQAGSTDTIVKNADGTWALRRKDGQELHFNKEGHLTADVDRFGNGFRVEYELTPLYRLFQYSCGPEELGSRTLHHRQCAVLAYLMGEISRPDVKHDGWHLSAADFPVTDKDLIYARSYFLHILSLGHGIQSVYGAARLRPTKVTDDLGRTLRFNYIKGDPVSPAKKGKEYDFSKKPEAELLQSVTGPGGSQLKFRYDRPPAHPQRLNEMFLTRVERKDTPTTSDLQPAPDRKTEYRYQWPNILSLPYYTHAKILRTRYQIYYETFVGCYLQRQYCPGELAVAEKAPGDPADIALHQVEGYLSEVADNIIEMINNGVISLESRYEIDPFTSSFDKVVDQRYGSSLVQQDATLIRKDFPTDQWQTTLPKSSYRYHTAGPVTGGNDRTDELLPATLRQRYPLEESNLKLEAPTSCEPAVGAAPEPNKISCDYDKMKKLIKELPGYQETLPYFSPIEQEAHPNLRGRLYRSRLTCAQLAMSQMSDPTHNDLLSDLVPVLSTKDTTDHIAERIAGHRKSVAADANRICAWTDFRDRDGDLHYYGLNFQGQVLVDAVQERTTKDFIVTEHLYNADGMVLQTRRPTRGSKPWGTPAGYTAFTYEELNPGDNEGWNDWIPVYWSRRTNLLREETIAAGGGILDEPETTGGSPSKSLGRYKKYKYEPLFSQVNYEETGTIREKPTGSSGGNETEEVPHSRITTAFDYQELNWDDRDSIKPLLDRFRRWGFGWIVEKDDYDYKNISGWQLPVRFYNSDLNGDGEKGFAYRTFASGRAVGLPIMVQQQPVGLSAGFETTVISYGPSGQPASLETPSGQRYRFSYYALAKPGSSSYGNSEQPKVNEVSAGFGGFLAKVEIQRLQAAQYEPTEGPPAKPCSYLAGPYQWVLPEACTSDVKADLVKLGLQSDLIDHIVASTNPAPPGAWLSTTFSYTEVGKPHLIWNHKGKIQLTLDVDGRIRTITDQVGNHTEVIYSVRGNPLLTYSVNPLNKVIKTTTQHYDEEGRILYRCEALSESGCEQEVILGATPPKFPDPVKDGVVNQFSYFPEGALKGSIDPEGLRHELTRNERKLIIQHRQEDPSEPTSTRSNYYEYTIDGDLEAVYYGAKPGSGGRGPRLSERYKYDGLQRVTQHTDVRGSNRHWAYTNRDEVARTKQSKHPYYAIGAAKPLWETTYRYDGYGRVIEVQDNEVTTARYRRGKGGRIFAWSAAGLSETFFTYDGIGNVVWSVDSDGSQTLVGQRLNPDRAFWAQVRRNKTGKQLTTGRTIDFDILGLPILETEFGNASSRTSTTLRDSIGYVMATVNPDGTRTEYERNFLGWPKKISELTAFGPSQAFDYTQLTYNKRGQLRTLSDPAHQVTQWTYSGYGELGGVTIPGQPAIKKTYTYDALGRLNTELSGRYELSYQYDKRGDLFEIGYRQKNSDPFRMLSRKSFDELGRNIETVYNNVLLSHLAPSERLVIRKTRYDDLGRVELESVSIGNHRHETKTTWELIANKWVRRVDGGVLEESYDQRGRMESIIRRPVGQQQSKIVLDWLGEYFVGRTQEQVGRSSPFREIREIGPFGELSKLDYTAIDVTRFREPKDRTEGNDYCGGQWNATYCAPPLLSISAQREMFGKIVSLSSQFGFPVLNAGKLVTKPHLQTWRGYAYNPMGQLSEVWEHDGNSSPPNISALPVTGVSQREILQIANLSGADRVQYKREAHVGAATKIAESKTGITRWELPKGRGPGHQLQSVDVDKQNLKIQHDLQGQITSDGKHLYEFDPLGRLAQFKNQPSLVEQYAYDDIGRLIAVFRGNSHKANETFRYDGFQIVTSFDSLHKPKWEATWGPGIDQLLIWHDRAGQTGDHIPITDHRNTVIATWQSKKNVGITHTADYDPEGRVTLADHTGKVICTERGLGQICSLPGGFPFGFTMAIRLQSSGLVWMRGRWYSAQLGQFISADPSGPLADFNSYRYAGGDPINQLDPLGLDWRDFKSITMAWHAGVNNIATKAGGVVQDYVDPTGLASTVVSTVVEFFGHAAALGPDLVIGISEIPDDLTNAYAYDLEFQNSLAWFDLQNAAWARINSTLHLLKAAGTVANSMTLLYGTNTSASNRFWNRPFRARAVQEANAVGDTGARPVVAIVEKQGEISVGRSGGQNAANADPLVKDLYQNAVPKNERLPYFMCCAEVPALSETVRKTGGVEGARSAAAKARPSSHRDRGKLIEACKNCKAALDKAGVTDVVKIPGLKPQRGESAYSASSAGKGGGRGHANPKNGFSNNPH